MNGDPHTCPMCFGTGRGRLGGPCRHCRGRGEVAGAQYGAARMGALGGAIMTIFFGGIALVVLILFMVAVIRG